MFPVTVFVNVTVLLESLVLKSILIPLLPHAAPSLFIVTVALFAVQFAFKVTVASLVGVKFLKYCDVTFVLALFQLVFTLLVDVPYNAVVVSNPLVAVHPANVYPLLVGLLIVTTASYVAVSGAFVPFVPLS